MTNIKNIKWRLINSLFNEIPIFEILLKIENKISIKSLSYPKKNRNTKTKIITYNRRL